MDIPRQEDGLKGLLIATVAMVSLVSAGAVQAQDDMTIYQCELVSGPVTTDNWYERLDRLTVNWTAKYISLEQSANEEGSYMSWSPNRSSPPYTTLVEGFGSLTYTETWPEWTAVSSFVGDRRHIDATLDTREDGVNIVKAIYSCDAE